MDDLQIQVEAVLDEIKSLQNLTASLEKIGSQVSLPVEAQLEIAKSIRRIKSDLSSLEKLHVDLTGRLNRTESRKNIKQDLKALGNEQVTVKAKIDKAALKKSIQEASGKATTIDVDTNVDGAEDLEKVSNGLDSINKKSATTAASVILLHETLDGLEQAARYMISTAADLDKQLTDLRMVTGESYEDISRLVDSYNALAKELGSTTSQILDASTEWLRQGKSVEETQELITQSMILSKVGAMDAATATERLTSTMYGYKMEVDDIASIVDKLTSVDMEAAVSADGIAEALSHTASSAYLAGIELDKIIAYLTVVQETTQKSASVVGESFKSIFARLTKVTNGEAIDDMGEDISLVESTLRSLGIELRASETEFRDIDEVIDEVGQKFNSLDSVVQRQIVTAMGGVYQSENLLALLTNYDKVAKYVDVAANSAGTATEKFNAYQESMAAHYNTMIASAEALAKQTVPVEFLNGLMDAASAIMDFVSYTDLLKTALAGLAVVGVVKGLTLLSGHIKNAYTNVAKLTTAFDIMGKAKGVGVTADQMQTLLSVTKGLSESQLRLVVSNKALTNEQRMAILTSNGLTKKQAAQTLATMGLATAESTATTATFSLSGAMKALGAAIAANPIGFLATALTAVISIVQTATSAVTEAKNESIQAAAEARKAAIDEANAVKEAYVAYMQYADKQNLTADEESAFQSAVEQVTSALQNKTTALSGLTAGTEEYTEALKNATKEEMKQALRDAKDNLSEIRGELEDLAYSEWFGGMIGFDMKADLSKASEDYVEAWNIAQETLGSYSRHFQNNVVEKYLVNPDAYDADSVIDYYLTLLDLKNQLNDADLIDTDIYSDVQTVVDGLSQTVDEYLTWTYEVASGEYLQSNDIPTTIEEFAAYRDYLNDVLGQDIEYSGLGDIIDGYLAEESDVYSQYINELSAQAATAEAIADKRQNIIDSIIGTDAWQAQNGEDPTAVKMLRSKIESLSDEELEIAYRAVIEEGGTTWRDITAAIEQYNAEQEIAKRHSNILKATLSELWDSTDFADVKNELVEISQTIDGITPQTVEELAAESDTLARFLEEDGMNAQFHANILQAMASGEDGLSLITEGALKLNDALDGMADTFDKVSDAKARYDTAMSIEEKDTNFQSYAEAYKTLSEQFEAGTVNSNAFWASAEFLFGSEQLSSWGWEQGLDQIYAAMEKNKTVFEDADSAGAGFIDRLYEMSEAGELVNENGERLLEITKDSAGTYDFEIDPANIEAIAEKMGITEEATLACLEALSMWGDVGFYDLEEVMAVIEEIGLAAETTGGKAVNLSLLRDQLETLGKTEHEISRIISGLDSLDGVTLLSVTDDVETLTTNLQELGLAAGDGVTVSVNYEGLADLMSQLGFTKDEAQNLINKLGEADGVSLANASGEVATVSDALEYIDTITFAEVTENVSGVTDAVSGLNQSSTDNVTSEIAGVGSAADTARYKVESVIRSVQRLDGQEAVVTYTVKQSGGILGMLGFAKGTKNAPAGPALVGEEGEELWQSGDKAAIVGTNGPEIVNVNKGDKIWPAKQTKKILSKSGKRLMGTIPAYAVGLNVRPFTVAVNDGGGGGSSKKTESTVASTVAAAVKGAVTGAVSGAKEAAKGAVSGSVNTGKNKTGSTGSNKSSSSGGGSSGGSSSSNSSNNSSSNGFEEQYKKHQHLLAMDQESVDDYLAWLNQAYKDAYANNEIEIDDYYKYQEEVYSKLQDLFKDYLSDTEHQIDMMSNYEGSDAEIISMYQELMKAIEKEVAAARAAGLDDSDDYIQELQKKWMDYLWKINGIREEVIDNAKDAADELIDYRIDMLKQELETRRDALNTQLDDLKDFYDQQKEMLQDKYDQEKYLEEQAEKRKSVDDIQAELDQLKYDDSAWAQKRKLELQEELSTAQKDLSDFERENSLDEAMIFLDAQYEQQELLIQEEIAAIEEMLNDPAALYIQALEDIQNNTEELYEQMVEYNNKYGDGNPETVKEMWENAYVALKDYIDLFGEAYKDIALANATDYKEPDDSWDTNPTSGTNPSNQTTTPSTSTPKKEEEKKSTAPSLTKGSSITVKKSATHFSSKSGSVRMASFVPGGKYTVYQTSGNEVLIGRDGVYTGWIKKTDIVGYASGTKYASAGFHRFDERGSEYIFSDQGGDKYRLFSSGEKVLDAESANFLYDFASKKGVGIVDKIIAGIFGSADSIVERIAGSAHGSKENLSRAVRSVTDNRVINNNVDMSGDINIQGNADEKTVSEMRKAQRETVSLVLKELNKMKK